MYVRLEDFKNQDADNPPAPESDPYPHRNKKITADIAKLESQLAQVDAATAALSSKDSNSSYALRQQIARKKRALSGLRSGKTAQAADAQPPEPATYVEFRTVPIAARFEAQGFRTADTLKATFPFRDAPLESRIMRECLVELYVGTVTVENFATRENWILPAQLSDTTVLVFRGYVDEWESPHDEGGSFVTLSARSFEAVLIDGKINPRAPAYRVHGAEEKISAFVNRILEAYPPTSGKYGSELRAFWYMADPAKETKLSAKELTRNLQTAASRAAADGTAPGQEPAPRPQQPADEAQPAQATGGDSGDVSMPQRAQRVDGISIWDLITMACELAGCIPIYDPSLPAIKVGAEPAPGQPDTRAKIDPKNCILLRPPQTIYDDVDRGVSIKGGSQDGFSRELNYNGRAVQSDLRMLVWGHNIKALKFVRKMSRARAVGVEVRSYNPDAPPAERLVKARYPVKTQATHMKIHGPKGKSSTAPIEVIKTILVRGIRSEALLQKIAAALFNQLSRQEISVHIETEDLASYIDPTVPSQHGTKALTHNANPDLLKLRPGTPVRILVANEVQDPDAGNSIVISTLSEVMDRKGSRIKQLLTDQNARFRAWQSPAEVEANASKIQAALQSAQLPDHFYCKTISLDFKEDGVAIAMELINYLEARFASQNLDEASRKADQELKLASRKKPKRGREQVAAQQQQADQNMLAQVRKALHIGGS